MDLCGCKYSSHHIKGISHVLSKSTARFDKKKPRTVEYEEARVPEVCEHNHR